jgi:hypothetical protein
VTIPAGNRSTLTSRRTCPAPRCRSASLLPSRVTRSAWPAHPGAAGGPAPTAVSDRSPGGTGEKRAALEALVDHIVPGRSVDTRGSSEGGLRIARIVRLPIDEASAKLADPGVPRAAAGRGPGRAGRGRAGERLVQGDAGDGDMSEPEEGGGVWTVFARGATIPLQPAAAEQAPRGKRRGNLRPSGEGRRCLTGVRKAGEKYVSGNLR